MVWTRSHTVPRSAHKRHRIRDAGCQHGVRREPPGGSQEPSAGSAPRQRFPPQRAPPCKQWHGSQWATGSGCCAHPPRKGSAPVLRAAAQARHAGSASPLQRPVAPPLPAAWGRPTAAAAAPSTQVDRWEVAAVAQTTPPGRLRESPPPARAVPPTEVLTTQWRPPHRRQPTEPMTTENRQGAPRRRPVPPPAPSQAPEVW
mmetsp:Transcript_98695/g.211533  ORF Transcript_98695/g.211533 Transcript_98695/m.211533 type:complete len:201 (+) Transcript_98695:188-790(+)